MAKLTLANITSGYQTTVTQNANNDLIEAVIENTLSRDGSTPNTMGANLDMNNNKITNLAAPTVNSDAARLIDIQNNLNGGALVNGNASNTFLVAPATGLTMAPEALQIQNQSLIAFITGGTSTAYTLTPTPAITAYVTGQCFDVTFNQACGASPTLAISGLASPPNLVRLGFDGVLANIGTGEITAGMTSRCRVMSSAQILVERLTRPTKTGTWTPSVGGNATYTTQLGYWIDFGDCVLVWGVIGINVIGTGSTTTITGLPFAPAGDGLAYCSGTCEYWASLATAVTCLIPTTNAVTGIQFSGVTAASANITAPVTVFQNSARIDLTITYRK
jgi:hypothetical protein